MYCGDCLKVMKEQIENEIVDLCYIDPPFNSDRDYVFTKNTSKSLAFKDKWKWNKDAENSFEEILKNEESIYTNQTIKLIAGLENVLERGQMLSYIVYMTQRIQEIWRILKPTGSFYLHCDPTMSHYLKLLLDSIFVARGGSFVNEIVWYFTKFTTFAKKFIRLHDIIFYYKKSKNFIFNELREEYGENSGIKDSHYKKDENGKWFRWQKFKNKEAFKIYLSEGRRMGDVWKLPLINSSAKERLGYPTQKPEALLERIIKASSNEGDTILDAFCGSGTTIGVAEKLKRRWIGIDISPIAIELTKQRVNVLTKKDVFICKNYNYKEQ